MGSKSEIALIVGAGQGLSAAIARAAAADGLTVALASRHPDRLTAVADPLGATRHACDVSDPDAVTRLFADVQATHSTPDLVVFNPSYRYRGAITDLDPAELTKTLAIAALGGAFVAQAAARAMLARGRGTLLFTGASASLKGYPKSAPFAMAKFALRGLAESLARELGPQNLHVAHIVIDGVIAAPARGTPSVPDSYLDPDAIAATYLALHRQPRSAWTNELTLRPWVERF